jgi:heptosyltransferase-2
MTMNVSDNRPKTVVLQHDLGIGDLIFRLPYIRAIAQQSKGGRVTLIARPTCRPHDLLRAEPSVEAIIEYDRWRKEDKRGRHRGLLGHWRQMSEVCQGDFERIVIFSGRVRYGLLAALAGIPVRIGYGGFGWSRLQRLFLNHKPFIRPYCGPCNSNYQLGTALAVAHHFTDVPLVPRLHVPQDMEQHWAGELSDLPQKRFVFAMGASDKAKDWGWQNFAQLAEAVLRQGQAVICLGGKAEEPLLEKLWQQVVPELRDKLRVLTPPSVLDSAAIARTCCCCIGNDTGMVNVAAACGIPVVLLIGHRPPLCHDPAIHSVKAQSVAAISLQDVLDALAAIDKGD